MTITLVTLEHIHMFKIRIRIRVYAGPRGIFACLNHDKDQPCRAVQQSAWLFSLTPTLTLPTF